MIQNNPKDNNIISEEIRGFKIQFKTKPGIFSKSGIDAGTKLLVENMQIREGGLIADLGAGIGVVGFVAAKLNYTGHIHLLESNLRAFELANQSIELNKLKNVEVFLSDLFSAVEARTYHQIFSNPPQQMGNQFLEELIQESFNHLKPQGELVLVVKSNLKPVVERFLSKIFENSKSVVHNKGYVVLKAVKNG